MKFTDTILETRGNIHYVDFYKIMEHLWGSDMGNWPDYMEQFAPVKAWIQEQIGEYKYTFYGACKEDFFEREAWDRAKSEGSTILFMENLS